MKAIEAALHKMLSTFEPSVVLEDIPIEHALHLRQSFVKPRPESVPLSNIK
jgi:hypothetical protein